MNSLLLALISFPLIPILAIVIDGLAGLRASKKNTLPVPKRKSISDFSVLVPIYGNMKYLENTEYLSQYGSKVMLCTTGDESDDFYQELRKISRLYGFKTFIDEPTDEAPKKSTTQRATSGTIRDRLVRNALLQAVTSQYVVPIDADTVTVQPIDVLVSELAERQLDIASVKLVLANADQSWLTRLQYHEYRLAMQLRLIAPWMISGACHVAKTAVLRDIMSNHSLFFQGNDVETGVIAVARGYRVGHIAFEVPTAVPATLQSWLRQRLAWAGGEFRLFIPNFKFVLQHPFLWLYGAGIVILLFPFRWLTLAEPHLTLAFIFELYFFLVFFLHWQTRDMWILVMPFYSLFLSLVITPLGIFWYFMMALKDNNWGVIRPDRLRSEM